MESDGKYLKPHALHEDNTFEAYLSKVPHFYFKKEVPDDVVKSFQVVRDLMVYSYFEYKFIDEAYTKSLLSFEMAMNFRNKELRNTKRNLRFSKLIQSLCAANAFEVPLELLLHVKDIRDIYAHPKMHSFGGIALWHRPEFMVNLINEMYEDIPLRIERRNLQQSFSTKLLEAGLNNDIVLIAGMRETYLYKLHLIFTDNKPNPPEYHLTYTPPFDLSSETDNDIINPQVLLLSCNNFSFTNGTLEISDERDGDKIYLIRKSSNKQYFSWLQALRKKNQQWMYDHAIRRSNGSWHYQIYGGFLKR